MQTEPPIADRSNLRRDPFRFRPWTISLFGVAVLLAGIGWYDAAMIGRFFAILLALAITVFMMGAPLWPWLMRRRRSPVYAGLQGAWTSR
jgi:hypothetical protein